jgi:mannose-6-phosphate isomerase
MRRDKDGNLRELHVDKAMEVSLLTPYVAEKFDGADDAVIGKCEYFETSKYKLKLSKMAFNVDKTSFLSITCVDGNGMIEGEKIAKGDTFFIPSGTGEITVSGNLDIIAVKVPNA